MRFLAEDPACSLARPVDSSVDLSDCNEAQVPARSALGGGERGSSQASESLSQAERVVHWLYEESIGHLAGNLLWDLEVQLSVSGRLWPSVPLPPSLRSRDPSSAF